MKTSMRRWIGIALISLSILSAIGMYLAGMPLVAVSKAGTAAAGAGIDHIEIHFPILMTLAAFVLGIVLVFIPRRSKHP